MTTRLHLLVVLLLASLLGGCASTPPAPWREAATQDHPWGYFSGEPVTQWNRDGRSMTLLREFRYTDPTGYVWVAPAGSVVDGASIPRPLWTLMGGPFEGKYRYASVLHDVAYTIQNRPPKEADRMFYHAMRCSGVGPIEAKTLYFALLRFGWHWDFSVKRAKPVKINRKMVARALPKEPVTVAAQQEIHGVQDWIRSANPSVEEIEEKAESVTPQR
ncbi:MAG: DUF1353 domain-containing protein [Verrucomicrobiota bacterium]|nr:DUF1353 domain-containing protein [Chthoniobacterales bacterium]MDQ3545711.1 DUF1353 domain-containing protein [Verrucomicrobiota bacterium]